MAFLTALPPYRLAAQCPDGTPPPCRTASAARPAPAASPTSVAVFPFENRSPDTTDAYLAVGMTEEIGNRLTQLGRLQIKSRGLVKLQWQRTPEPIAAARALGVAWFVHGNLRHASNQLVVNVELVRANGEEAWASRFARHDADVFAVQSEIAESVAVVVGGRLSPVERATLTRRPTTDNEAYRLYLYGNALANRRTAEDLRAAVASYEQALALDPSFAAAWARLGLARDIQSSWGWEGPAADSMLLARGMAAARRAVALDSSSAEGWVALGNSLSSIGDMAPAHQALMRALRLDSTSAEVYHQVAASLYTPECSAHCLALPAQAIPLLHRALAYDPTLRNTWRHLATAERDSGLLALAKAHLDTALSFGPWPPASGDRALINYLTGAYDSALVDLAAGRGAVQSRETWLPQFLQAARGDSAPARRLLAELQADTARGLSGDQGLAITALLLGQREVALAALEQARRIPEPPPVTRCSATTACSANLDLWRVLQDPLLVPLRNEPRFQRLWNETRPRVPWLGQ